MKFPFEEDDADDIELFPHTSGHFCPDVFCPCHEDTDAIGTVGQWVQDGLMTVPEANDFYRGKLAQ